MGLFAVLLAGVNYLLVRRPPTDKIHVQAPELGQHADKPADRTLSAILRSSKFWLIGISYLFVGYIVMVSFTFLVTYAVQEATLSYAAATRLITVVGITAMVSKLVMGTLSDTIGRIRIMMLCSVLLAAGNLGIAYGQGVWTLTLFTAVFGVGYGSVWSMYAASASDYFPKEYAGSIIGLWTFLVGIGCIISPILSGWIADTTGTLTWSFTLAMVASVVSVLLLVPVWRAGTGSSVGN